MKLKLKILKIIKNNFFNEKLKKYKDLYFLDIKTLKDFPTQEEWAEVKKIVDIWFNYCEKKNIKIALLFNLASLSLMYPSFGIDGAKYLKERSSQVKKYIIGTAFIVQNTTVRSLINMVLNLYHFIKPVKLVENKEEGLEFFETII